MSTFKPRLIISVHGIHTKPSYDQKEGVYRTIASWQKGLDSCLLEVNINHEPYGYGYFKTINLFRKKKTETEVNKFHDFYYSVIKKYGIDLKNRLHWPSVVVHSFGSYIVVNCMTKYEEIKFDKIILCGSILPTNFDWDILINRDQINLIRNEYGREDFWVHLIKFAKHFGYGNSGEVGFNKDFFSNHFQQQQYERHDHPDYLHKNHISSTWIPFLKTKPAPLNLIHGKQINSEKKLKEFFIDTDDIDKKTFGDEYVNTCYVSESFSTFMGENKS